MPVNERTVMYGYFQKTKVLNKNILSMFFYKATKPYSNVVFETLSEFPWKALYIPTTWVLVSPDP